MSAERPSLKAVGSQEEKLLEEKHDLRPPFSPYKTGVVVTPVSHGHVSGSRHVSLAEWAFSWFQLLTAVVLF